MKKDGNKKIEKKIILKLKKAGLYDLAKEPIEKFAKKLNQYFANEKGQRIDLKPEDRKREPSSISNEKVGRENNV